MNNSEILKAAQKAADTAQDAAQEAVDRLAELKEQMAVKAWPQVGDRYCYLLSVDSVYAATWINTELDKERNARGNVYRTYKEAKQADAVLVATTKVLDRIKELKGDWVCAWSDRSQEKYFFAYKHADKRIVADCLYGRQGRPSAYHFPAQIKDQLLSELEPEIKIMLGVES